MIYIAYFFLQTVTIYACYSYLANITYLLGATVFTLRLSITTMLVSSFFNIRNDQRLLEGKTEDILHSLHSKQDVDFLNGSASVLECFFNEIVRFFACHVLSKEEAFIRMNKKDISQQQSDSSRWSTLMIKAQAGSESDYQLLLTELANVIHAYLRNRLGNQHFIEDCVQESLLAIHRARHTYDPQRPFRPWLFTIVRHKLIDYLRHNKNHQRIIEHHQQEEELRNQGAQPNMVEDSIDGSNLLNSLRPQHKEILNLTKLSGFTCAEAAKQLGISESAVKVRVYRAINKLRQLMEAKG